MCLLWKTAVSRMWKIKKLRILNHSCTTFLNIPSISATDARKIINQAAEFTEEFEVHPIYYQTKYTLFIGPFRYKVVDGNTDEITNVVKLVANNATRITSMTLRHAISTPALGNIIYPHLEAMGMIFKRNEIKKVETDTAALKVLCEEQLTDRINEIEWCLGHPCELLQVCIIKIGLSFIKKEKN